MPIVDKLGIINSCLGELHENQVAVADDGSEEWTVCSAAYENAVPAVMEAGNWTFDTQIAPLVRVGASPDDLYNDAMAMPANCLHLIWVRINDEPGDYKIIGNQICLNLDGYNATAKFVLDSEQTGAWPPSFVQIIRYWVRAAIFRMREESALADGEEKKAMLALTLARTRVDQQGVKRATFNSRARLARIVRRPFIRTPFPYGGTGVPE